MEILFGSQKDAPNKTKTNKGSTKVNWTLAQVGVFFGKAFVSCIAIFVHPLNLELSKATQFRRSMEAPKKNPPETSHPTVGDFFVPTKGRGGWVILNQKIPRFLLIHLPPNGNSEGLGLKN